MPPRYVYWTIIYGNAATSFRAATREELLPTLKQLQSRHPDAVMKFFARGKLWDSEEEARQWRDERKQGRPAVTPSTDRRGKDWRPGGKHRDPRDRFKVPRDVKRKRFADRLRRDRLSPRPSKVEGGSTGPSTRPPQDRWRADRPKFQSTPDRDDRNKPSDDRARRGRRPGGKGRWKGRR